MDRAKTVTIFGEEIAVKASVHTLRRFSAHADQKELPGWLSEFKKNPEVSVVHGEEETSLAFAELIKERYGFIIHVPLRGESFELQELRLSARQSSIRIQR